MLETGEAPEDRGRTGLKQTSDTGAIDAEIDKILAANADKVAEYKGGKQQLFGFFVGQTMKAMAGKANPASGQRAAPGKAGLTLTTSNRECGHASEVPGRTRGDSASANAATPPCRPLQGCSSSSLSISYRRTWRTNIVRSSRGALGIAMGTVFRRYQSHAATETCPGHSTC